ncbi:MAG: serine/threonine-protein kinase [Isosphaeraceae bacterium]
MNAPSPGPREPYRKIRKIGAGGLGVVYLAHDEQLDRKVAIKEVRPNLVHDPNIRKRFEYEARVNAALEHPGIVPVHAAAIDGTDDPYFVTRFIEGRSLSQEIAELHREPFWGRRLAGEKQLALQRLLRRFVVVCETVAYAHSRGVVHRDLKPAHILFGPFGETLVIDWGLAKPIDGGADAETTPSTRSRPLPAWDRGELTITGDEVGTPLYASPEQARGEHDRVGPASDTFSLGSILYQVLTGWPPFRRNPPGGHARDPVAAVDFLRPRAIHPGIPRELEAICLKAMEREPETRYPSPLALAEDLERWLAGEPVSVHRESAAARLLRWSRRRRITSGVLVGVLATSLLALVFLLGQSNLSRSRVARPIDLIEAARPEEVPGLADMLHQDAPAALAVIHQRQAAARTTESRLALGLAALHLSDEEAPALEGLLREEPAAQTRLASALVGEAGVPLRNLVRPVGPGLVDELLKAESSAFDYRDREPWTSARRALAEYAEGRPDALARCLAYAEAGEYEELLAKLGRCDSTAARGALRQLLLRLSAGPPGPEPDPSWAAPPADALAAIAAAGGLVHESFLVAQTLDLARVRVLTNHLMPLGFRPARFRPYRSEDGRLMVAAVWLRDGAAFAFEEGLSAEGIVGADRRHAETLIPVDVAVYPGERGEAVYAAVWAEPDRPYRVLRDDLAAGFFPKLDALSRRRHPSRRIVAGLGLDEARSQDGNRNSENWSTLCVQVLRTADGRSPTIQIRDSRSLVGPSFALECSTREALADLQAHGLLQSDVCVDPGAGGGASPVFVTTWVEPRTGESVLALAAGRGEHLLEMTRLADLGYSPVSVSLREGPGGPLAASVWARPQLNFRNVQPSDLAARITVGLLRLGDEAPAWELLRLQADPTTRAFLIEALPRLGVPI